MRCAGPSSLTVTIFYVKKAAAGLHEFP
jgi:hypothetical protein